MRDDYRVERHKRGWAVVHIQRGYREFKTVIAVYGTKKEAQAYVDAR